MSSFIILHQYEYKDYYRRLIEDWDFEDDNEGGWTISTEDNHYSFSLLNGMWQMTDKNGDTVDTFPPFSTLEEDESEIAGGYKINDNGADSPRVVGEVTGGTERLLRAVLPQRVTIPPLARQTFLRAILTILA